MLASLFLRHNTYIYINYLYACPYFFASDPFNFFMGSVLAGFIIGIQELGIRFIPTAFPVRFSACHYFDSFVWKEFWSHDILF